MLIGLIGAPNKGKSTLFSAMTMNEVGIANYPFTTIDPNLGVAYANMECAEKRIGIKCNPRNSTCTDGIRHIPINVVDVAGLVDDASSGKGMGNQFLNDAVAADALLVVVDISGKTDKSGNPCEDCDPSEDIAMVKREMAKWLFGILKKHMPAMYKCEDSMAVLADIFNGIHVDMSIVEDVIGMLSLPKTRINWRDAEITAFSSAIIEKAKPLLVVANKSDAPNADKNLEALGKKYTGKIIPTSAAVELALRKAAQKGIITYSPGARSFRILDGAIDAQQKSALSYMGSFISSKGTNVQEAVDYAAFSMLGNIVVYPVEDENKYTDHFGNILPDAILIKKGSTAMDLARMIHTDIAKNMLYAVDAITKRRLAKDYVLQSNDIIKIVSAIKPK
ncbi:YchF-related putative GTPase [Candidatus Marsarchaeota archaeon]|jgi:ribosome-binding ATPase YchF (GTP1/OBG family)|nr:YchF-related putative GTPase [Candidatus Marsarchaeota archaeon]MCL5092283.1 YchF-related putative GTPase [Candidatus Marsarchaeota archaeon]